MVPVRKALGGLSRESRGRRIDPYRPENYATSTRATVNHRFLALRHPHIEHNYITKHGLASPTLIQIKQR